MSVCQVSSSAPSVSVETSLPASAPALRRAWARPSAGHGAHGNDFDMTAALAAQYPGAPARPADAQVQSIAVAIPLIAGRRLECAYSPIRQHLPLRECIRDTPKQ